MRHVTLDYYCQLEFFDLYYSQIHVTTSVIGSTYSTGGKHKARGAESVPPPCFIQPGTLFLPGGSTDLSLNC